MTWRRAVFFVLPVIVMVAASTATFPVLSMLSVRLLKTALGAALGVTVAGFLWRLIRGLGQWAKLPPLRVSLSWRRLLAGAAVGAVAASAAAGLLLLNLDIDVQSTGLVKDLAPRALWNVYPAATEEVVFRAGLVQGAALLGGPVAALLTGSVPFGVLHTINAFFGHEVPLNQVLGIILGGLLLSCLYLRFGLAAALGCHWVWNTVTAQWISGMELDPTTGGILIEGAWSTCALLAILSALVWFGPKWLRRKNPCAATEPVL